MQVKGGYVTLLTQIRGNTTGALEEARSNVYSSTNKNSYNKESPQQSSTNSKRKRTKKREYSNKKTNDLNNLRCLYFNATSIGSGHKWRQFRRFVAAESYRQVIGIAETWFNYKSLKNIKNYTLFNKDREEIKGGGVALYTRNDLRAYFPKEKKLMETKSEQV